MIWCAFLLINLTISAGLLVDYAWIVKLLGTISLQPHCGILNKLQDENMN